jgi:hypothetical protein
VRLARIDSLPECNQDYYLHASTGPDFGIPDQLV